MNEVWCSIIILTLYERPIVLDYLPSEAELIHRGYQLIVVWDRWGWNNASKTRNIGAVVAQGSILCFIDDDAGLNFTELNHLLEDFLRLAKQGNKVFYWSDAPHILIVTREAFFLVGGYDERHPRRGAEAVEIRERLKHFGYELRYLRIHLIHHRDTWDKQHERAANKSFTWTYITYRTYPLTKVLWRKHPIELARRWLWVLEWILVTSHKRRSIFTR